MGQQRTHCMDRAAGEEFVQQNVWFQCCYCHSAVSLIRILYISVTISTSFWRRTWKNIYFMSVDLSTSQKKNCTSKENCLLEMKMLCQKQIFHVSSVGSHFFVHKSWIQIRKRLYFRHRGPQDPGLPYNSTSFLHHHQNTGPPPSAQHHHSFRTTPTQLLS